MKKIDWSYFCYLNSFKTISSAIRGVEKIYIYTDKWICVFKPLFRLIKAIENLPPFAIRT